MMKTFLFGEKTSQSSSLPPSSAHPTPSPPSFSSLSSEQSFALKHDVSIKIVIVGAPGVGKTTIARQYIGAQPRTAYVPTIGPEVLSKYVPLNSLQAHVEYKGKLPEGLAYDRVKVDLWEVPHQELYGHNINRIVSGANGFVIVFDSSVPATFAAVNEWFTAIKVYKEEQGSSSSGGGGGGGGGDSSSKCERPCVISSPPLVPVESSKNVMSTLEKGKVCAFSVPTILLAHKADVNAPTPECASLIGGLNAYCSEFGALFWAKTSSQNGAAAAAALKRVLDMFVNSVFDNYLRREELRIVMAAERSKARRAKIRPVQVIQHEGGNSDNNNKSLQLQQQQQQQYHQQQVRKEVLEKAERLQLDVSEYSKIGKEAIQRAAALPESEKHVMLGKFDEDITKLAAAVAALVKSAASAAAAPPADLSAQKQCDDTGKAVERVRGVFGRKKAKWDDILSKASIIAQQM